MKNGQSRKILLFFLAVLMVIGILGCSTSDEPEPVTEPIEDAAAEETDPPEKEVEPVPLTKEGVCWTDMALDSTITASIMMEGMEEEVYLTLFRSQQHPFAIYYDEERYEWHEDSGKDFLIPYHKPDDQDVWMAIWHEEASMEQVVEEKQSDLEAKYAETILEEVKDPLKAFRLTALEKLDGEDHVEYWLIAEAQDGGVILIHQKMFTEALEGHGQRLDFFLRHFYGLKDQTLSISLTDEAKAQMEDELQKEENRGKIHIITPGIG